ncbi:sulfatase family protein [Clostridium tarantellae]|uniref:Sulfatase-like hydrolase/transferase n=1 Tax=Clostridium tarantellae TaxID=39493 RepID=A0A6I1MP28_9CLOT|nr:sulfatase-like hydrolase/transferase [Clostridium tarantellae]MPQ44690.1 sulfatase-like hydrolase/transferase [Clostridium tarantellae]
MKKKNVLLITSDQQHWNTLGFFNPEIKTPNLDRLIKEGTTFSRAYCPNPTCTPTRCSLITGLYPSQHGGWSLGTKMPEETLTIGDILMKKGYRTGLVGKAHFQHNLQNEKYSSLEAMPIIHDLDFWKTFQDVFYGFDHIELTRNHTVEFLVGQHYAIWMEEKGFNNWKDYYQPPIGTLDPSSKRIWEIPEEFHYNTWISERSNKLLEEYKNKNENFFLWSSFFDPHPPYFVPEPWASMYDPNDITLPHHLNDEHEKTSPLLKLTQEIDPDYSKYYEPKDKNWLHGCHSHIHNKEDLKKDIAIYYGMISMMDNYIGKILDKLDELKLTDNTIIVFTSDHGHFFGQHNLIAKGPFHYEDMIKVPLIVKEKGVVPESIVNESLQSLVDFTPTILSKLGFEIPRTMAGKDQSKVWNNEKKSVRNYIMVENQHTENTVNLRTLVNERYKLTVYYNKTHGELYDLKNDPLEFNNLWNNSEYAELKSKLLLDFMWAEMDKVPLWMPRVSLA